jgi:hypothetical protein
MPRVTPYLCTVRIPSLPAIQFIALVSFTVSLVGLGIEKRLEFSRVGHLDLAEPSWPNQYCFRCLVICTGSLHSTVDLSTCSAPVLRIDGYIPNDSPSLWGFLLSSPGWSASASLISWMTPETGAYISEAALTDSTAPIASTRTYQRHPFCGIPRNHSPPAVTSLS